MVLQWHDRHEAVAADHGQPGQRTHRLIVPGSIQDPKDQRPRMLDSSSNRPIERVSVLPGDGVGNKPSFTIVLELGQDHNTSSSLERTWRETGIELEIEERELASFARLTGKNVLIRSRRSTAELRVEDLKAEIRGLQEENSKLRQRKASLEEQLQFAVDQLRNS